MIDDRHRRDEEVRARPAYAQLFAIGCSDSSYPVQLAAAQEIGVGGETAYEELSRTLTAPCPACDGERAERLEQPDQLPRSRSSQPEGIQARPHPGELARGHHQRLACADAGRLDRRPQHLASREARR